MLLTKYSASGNDFVLFHTFKKADRSQLARILCHRQEGVGADGLIVLVPHDEYDFQWEFYNSDGSHAAMCGNGSRAAALYAFRNGLAGAEMKFLTDAGVIGAEVDGLVVKSQLTPPEWEKESFEEEGRSWAKLDTGVPHLVTLTDDLGVYDKALSRKMRVEHNANVNYVKAEEGALRVRTYERGVEDETLACGTGMVACFLTARALGLAGEEAKVYPASGEELTLGLSGGVPYLRGAVKPVMELSFSI